jgi:FtsP/CotA-like multicopper oxidase with cupredoxin domain
MKKKQFKMTRRQVLKAGMIGGAGMMLPLRFLPRKAFGEPAAAGLSDPALQPKFVELAPNALDPAFLFKDLNENGGPAQKPNFSIRARQTRQETGLIDPNNGRRLKTDVWGYGSDTVTWPGQTIQIMSTSAGGADETVVRWENELGNKHLLPVDENLHWAYSLHGASSANGVDYRQYSIRRNGVPIITHLHGGNTAFQYDGNPEFFYSPDGGVKGPQWDFAPDGFTNTFRYNNDVPAGNLWYHDHGLGITRLNVYAGLAGFYFVRDNEDTGTPDNLLGLPAFPYELAYAIQDRMFTDKGALFYPAFPGDPFYEGFITDEGAILPEDLFPGGGPTALAEFFGDHMVVNGKIWPKENVERRNYRMHLLNGTDSRFLVVRFRQAASLTSENLDGAGPALPFTVIGSDQGLATEATEGVTQLVSEPGSRYDIVFDFSQVEMGSRIIMENFGWDAPFGGDFGDNPDPDDVFPNRQTDRIMAFDVILADDAATDAAGLPAQDDVFDSALIGVPSTVPAPDAPVRQVALFEGTDEFGRLQPLLGANTGTLAEPVWSAIAWHSPTTELPTLDTTEEWEIYNFTGDAHPVHLHLVHFEILGRNTITYDSDEGDPGQQVLQHNGLFGVAPVITDVQVGAPVNLGPDDGYVENAPKDMVTALPDQVTRIKATFDKPGRYVWHCHILSHEDHEMMRVLQVVPAAPA